MEKTLYISIYPFVPAGDNTMYIILRQTKTYRLLSITLFLNLILDPALMIIEKKIIRQTEIELLFLMK